MKTSSTPLGTQPSQHLPHRSITSPYATLAQDKQGRMLNGGERCDSRAPAKRAPSCATSPLTCTPLPRARTPRTPVVPCVCVCVRGPELWLVRRLPLAARSLPLAGISRMRSICPVVRSVDRICQRTLPRHHLRLVEGGPRAGRPLPRPVQALLGALRATTHLLRGFLNPLPVWQGLAAQRDGSARAIRSQTMSTRRKI